jgi:hypothetical protein
MLQSAYQLFMKMSFENSWNLIRKLALVSTDTFQGEFQTAPSLNIYFLFEQYCFVCAQSMIPASVNISNNLR